MFFKWIDWIVLTSDTRSDIRDVSLKVFLGGKIGPIQRGGVEIMFWQPRVKKDCKDFFSLLLFSTHSPLLINQIPPTLLFQETGTN